jgi:hypothetical protein
MLTTQLGLEGHTDRRPPESPTEEGRVPVQPVIKKALIRNPLRTIRFMVLLLTFIQK